MKLGEFLKREKGDSTALTRRSVKGRQLTPQAKVEVFIFFFLTFLLAGFPAYSQDFLAKKAVRLGEAVTDFELSDTEGKSMRLSSYQGKTVMIHFWSATCPFVVRYEGRIQEIAKQYGEKGVTVLGIASNVNETQEKIRNVAAERAVNYPILLDPNQEIADQFGAVTTPHIFIIDREGKLAYEGSVDDQGWQEENPVTKHYAREALDALLSDSPVPHPQTQSFGCTVKRRLA